jgi:hypothetical protein
MLSLFETPSPNRVLPNELPDAARECPRIAERTQSDLLDEVEKTKPLRNEAIAKRSRLPNGR